MEGWDRDSLTRVASARNLAAMQRALAQARERRKTILGEIMANAEAPFILGKTLVDTQTGYPTALSAPATVF